MKRMSKRMMFTLALAFCSLCAYAFLQYAYAQEKLALSGSVEAPVDHLEYDQLDDLEIPDIQLIKKAIDVAKEFWPVS